MMEITCPNCGGMWFITAVQVSIVLDGPMITGYYSEAECVNCETTVNLREIPQNE